VRPQVLFFLPKEYDIRVRPQCFIHREQDVHVGMLALRPDLAVGVHAHLLPMRLVGVRDVARLASLPVPVEERRRIRLAGRRDHRPPGARDAIGLPPLSWLRAH
jgi:hypothetical protein